MRAMVCRCAACRSLWHHAPMQNDEHLMALVNASRSTLLRAAARQLGPAEAEDAVQDAYVRALEAQAPALNAAQAWLLTVVRNLAIDRLRRRQWMAQWLTEATQTAHGAVAGSVAPSAEADAALAQQATLALRRLAACVTPMEGAAVLLHAVFDASHAELAQATGRTEAASRQQLRRALQRLRQAEAQARHGDERDEPSDGDPAVLRLYLQSLQLRNPQALWALLRQPPVSAMATQRSVQPVPPRASRAPATVGGVVQVGGQLGLVLTLDGVTLCVLPLGPCAELAQDIVVA